MLWELKAALEWNSNFFGLPVFRIDDAVSGAAELKETLHSISQSNITVAYYSSRKHSRLYNLWIINSVNRKIAREVLVYLDSNEIAGFVTLGEKSKRGVLGIIAGNAKFRGRGRQNLAESCFAGQGYGSVQVVTQGDNVPACRLYENCGYRVETVGFSIICGENRGGAPAAIMNGGRRRARVLA